MLAAMCLCCLLQLIHDASVEHLLLKETLQVRENRIAELETEVEALNKVIGRRKLSKLQTH